MGIAAWEGGWGNSRVALAKNNFYGIGVYDSDPLYWASTLGTNVHDGIVNGAVWIYEHYYLDGNTTLALINNNGYNGYNGGTYWAETITDQMINVHYRVCKEILSEEGGDNND
jgi:beta-N-acetylglucosaminidase